MPLQRRYSVTGQTPPDDMGAMKAPKLQDLDTSVQTTSCGLCSGGDEVSCAATSSTYDMDMDSGTEEGDTREERGRRTDQHTAVRTSSKRSATQLPSPSSPSHELPIKKLNRMGLEHDNVDLCSDVEVDMDEGSVTDLCPEESDWALSSYGGSSSASFPSSPESPPTSLHDELIPDIICLDEKPRTLHIDDILQNFAIPSPPPSDTPLPPTLLTLPPELRHQIYRHLPDLVVSHPLIYCLSTFANNMQHPLASVSNLIRTEALAIFYSYNTWVIKLEFKLMYDAFHDWIIRLGDGAGSLRLVNIAVRGSLFKPRTSHSISILNLNGQLLTTPAVPGTANPGVSRVDTYHPPDGDASFSIDLSEKWVGGKVQLMRNDGTKEAGEKARVYLEGLVNELWEKRRAGSLNGQHWVDLVETFLVFVGWW